MIAHNLAKAMQEINMNTAENLDWILLRFLVEYCWDFWLNTAENFSWILLRFLVEYCWDFWLNTAEIFSWILLRFLNKYCWDFRVNTAELLKFPSSIQKFLSSIQKFSAVFKKMNTAESSLLVLRVKSSMVAVYLHISFCSIYYISRFHIIQVVVVYRVFKYHSPAVFENFQQYSKILSSI